MNYLDDDFQIRQRIIRSIVGGLLNGPLTDDELKDGLMLIDSSFLVEIKSRILAALGSPSKRPKERSDSDELDADSDIAGRLYELVKTKKMSKYRFLKYLESISPKAAARFRGSPLSLREVIVQFCASEKRLAADQLYAILSGHSEQDPFLTGITNRR